MIIEEARDILQEQIDRYGQEYDAEGIEALKIAMRAVSSWSMYLDEVYKTAYARGYNDAKTERTKGHLISNQQDGEVKPFWERYKCSICGEYAQDNFNYCSRCGAELEGEEE